MSSCGAYVIIRPYVFRSSALILYALPESMECVDNDYEACPSGDTEHFCEKRKASAAFAIIALLMTALAAGLIASGLRNKIVRRIVIGGCTSFFAGTQTQYRGIEKE